MTAWSNQEVLRIVDFRGWNMKHLLLLAVALLPLVAAQRTGDWDRCNCRWATWEAWSKCSKLCYGDQRRTRSVWHRDIPSCEGFESCDAGAGARNRQVCNKHCTHGSYNGWRCACPPGRYGECCDQVVTCARPSDVSHGSVQGSRFQYGDTITYSCDRDYNLTGLNSRTCAGIWGWSGYKPRCQFAESCRSSPCKNNGVCVNGLDFYTCQCETGWSGKNCEIDIQPPVYDLCPPNKTVHTSDREKNCTWTIPTFSDPHGTTVRVSTNYHTNNMVLPWGDHTVYYRAVKESNGLETTCTFNISVRPHPCPSPTPPSNGYIVCNGWRVDYGQYCLLGCNANYELPVTFDSRKWMVCGASGQWSVSAPPSQCYPSTQPKGATTVGDCKADITQLQDSYIISLKRSSFNSVCLNHPDMCRADRVKIFCAK